MFVCVIWLLVPSVCLDSLVLVFHLSLSASSSTQIGCSSDTEHESKTTACLRDEWIRGGEKGGRSGEVEEEKVTVFPESKRSAFDHWERWCWSFKGCLVTDLRWLAGWRKLAKMWRSCVWRKSHQVLLELKQLQTPNFLLPAFKRWRNQK